MGYWWCPECEMELNSCRVTFQEQCDACFTLAECYETGEGPLWEQKGCKMHKFDKSKRYVFRKEIYLTKPGRAIEYKNSPACRGWVDEADRQNVTIIDELEGRVQGGADGYRVMAVWCEELIPHNRAIVQEVCQQRYEKGETR